MKLIRCLISCFLIFSSIYFAKAQDTLNVDHLRPHSKNFTLENGQIKGPGAEFLIRELSAAHITMIGEYHGSKRISELTTSLIPHLDTAGYKTMLLEVGPTSAQVLAEMGSVPDSVTARLRQFNRTYGQKVDDEMEFPIPFFYHTEDADFLQQSLTRNWQLVGIDQEYIFSYLMLAEQMFMNLDSENKKKHRQLFTQTKDTLTQYYQADAEGKRDFNIAVHDSKTVQQFLETMARFPINAPIVEDFKQSNHIYWLYSTRQWFDNNDTRIKYMKAQVRKGLKKINFDISQDRLLIKMGAHHVSRGFSPLGFYEVGNMLDEVSNFYGNKCLNVTFRNRYEIVDGELTDYLESDSKWLRPFRAITALGKKDEWVVIDLRPLHRGYFYHPQQYKLPERIIDLIKRYDLVLIPPVEMEPTINY